MAAMRLGRPVKWTEDRREHFISSAHERGQQQHITVGFDDDGRISRARRARLARQRRLHALRDHLPDRTSTQLLGPYKPGAYRVRILTVYTTTVIVTPYRGAGRPQGVFAMERTMDRIAERSAWTGRWSGARNLIQPDEFPFDQGLIFQDGRPLIYDSGNYPAQLEMIKDMIGWDDFEPIGRGRDGRPAARHRHRLLRRGHRARAVRGRAHPGAQQRQGRGRHRADLAGPGPPDGVRADRRRRTRRAVRVRRVTTGDTRRFGYAVGTFASRAAVMSGSAVALAARGVRAKALRVAADALEVDPDDLEIVDGVVPVKGIPAASIPLGQVAVLSNPLRYAFDEAAKAATQFAGPATRTSRRSPTGEAPGLEGTRLLLAAAVHLRLRDARRDRRDRPGDQRDQHRASTASCTTAAP